MDTTSSLRQRLGAVAVVGLAVLAAACDFTVGPRTGQLDPGFGGGDGVATFAGRARSDDAVEAAVRLDDGRLVTVGSRDGQRVFARYLDDGRPDESFGDGGVVEIGIASAFVRELTVAPDGDLVITGAFAGPGLYVWLIARFRPDGTPDADFGTDGVAQLSDLEPAVPIGYAYGAVPVGDDLYVRASRFGVDPYDDGVVVKLGPDAAVDTTFGPDGTGAVRVGSSGGGQVGLAAVGGRPDGAVVTTYEDGADAGLVTVSPAGVVGPRTSLTSSVTRPHRIDDLAVGGDGSVVLAGAEHLGFPDRIVLVRLTPGGVLDAGFGAGGVATVSMPVGLRAQVALDGDGVVVASDEGDVTGGRRITTARVTAAGSLDPGWGTAGLARYGRDAEVTALLSRPDGVLVVGATPSSGSADPADQLLLGLDPSGAPDPGFGDDGWAAADFGREAFDRFTVVEALPDGDVLVAGDTGDGLTVGRYGADGTPDADVPPAPFLTDRLVGAHVARDVAVLEDGTAFLLVQVGSGEAEWWYGGGGTGYRVVKLGPDGSVDETFGDGGVAAHDGADSPNAVAVGADGRVLVAHTVVHPAQPIPPHGVQPATFDLVVDALTPAGAPDTSWGTGGRTVLAAGAEFPPSVPTTGWLAVGPDGDAYLATYGLWHLDPAGAAVPVPALPAGVSFAAADVTVDPEGDVVATGPGTVAGGTAADLVARFDADLVLDASYGAGGLAELPATAAQVVRTGPRLHLADDGTVTVVQKGRAAGRTVDELVVRRLTPAGTADATFSGNGLALNRFRVAGVDAEVLASALADGDVLLAGATEVDAVLARVNG